MSLKTPTVNDLAAECEGGRHAVGSIVNALRGVEASIAKRENRRGQLEGDLEIDEHGIRSFHISPTNPAFAGLVPRKLAAKGHKYFLNYLRVIGMRVRGGGRVVLEFLPHKPLPPKSSPPVLSAKELVDCGILRRAKAHCTVIHSDGAWAYPKVLKKHFPALVPRAVVHKNLEFVRVVRPVALGSVSSSTLSGTQSIDSTWKSLDSSIPHTVKTKANHNVNPVLERYVFSWLYRVNRKNTDGFTDMGKELASLMEP